MDSCEALHEWRLVKQNFFLIPFSGDEFSSSRQRIFNMFMDSDGNPQIRYYRYSLKLKVCTMTLRSRLVSYQILPTHLSGDIYLDLLGDHLIDKIEDRAE